MLARVEADADRHPLNYLDVVAGRVFRGKDAAASARDRRDALDCAVEVFVQGIDVDSGPLPGVHPRELCLFEVCRHPGIAGCDDHHQGLRLGYAITDLRAALSDDAAHRGSDVAEAEIESGALQLRRCGFNAGLGVGYVCLAHCQLPRCGSIGLLPPRCLRIDVGPALLENFFGGCDIGLRGIGICLRRAGSGDVPFVILPRDRAGLKELFVTPQLVVVARADRFGFYQLRRCGRQILRRRSRGRAGLGKLCVAGQRCGGVLCLGDADRRTLRIQLRERLVVLRLACA